MTDINRLKVLAERAEALYGAPSLEHVFAITKFREAVEPKAILGLIAEIERLNALLKAEKYAYKDKQKHYEWLAEDLKECASALPCTYYMDPPDGGNVSIPEQIRRMAKDAARYRALRDEGYLHNWASLHVCDEHLRAQRTDEAIDSVLNIGAKQ
ncbi:TPA: hypothetical protein NIB40_004872 [Pseudomonas aeruginosa]|uniref:hypothetical protein n=1 Tax=Pseudomonas aeruginosa TaxID=287 RepID=UPI001CD5205D|nr:hypothetical protein [Pseudomonas aeruginosa]HCF2959110.1 hypothetical protein [Pseudomonas aeruginosa]